MMQRLIHIIDAALGLLGAQAQLLLRDLEQAAASALARLGAFVLIGVGAMVLCASLLVTLEGLYGWPAALLIVGGGITLVGVIIIIATRGGRSSGAARRSGEELAEAAASKAEALRSLAGQDDGESPGEAAQAAVIGVVDDAVKAVAKNPQIIVSGAFALLAVLGPGRALRMVGKAAAAAGFAASVARTMHSVAGDAMGATLNGRGRSGR